MTVKLKNLISGYLDEAIDNATTTITLQAGDGASFPSLSVGEYFYLTLVSTSGTIEIVKVTARATDTLTVIRAQEGTTAASFVEGARVEMRVTAQSVLDAAADAAANMLPIAADDVEVADVDTYYDAVTVEDILAEIGPTVTNAIVRDGSVPMSSPLKHASGNAAAPSLTFNSDSDTGFFLESDGVIGVSTAGVKTATISSAGFVSESNPIQVTYHDSTTDIKALGATAGRTVALVNGARQRLFTLRSGNYATLVAADAREAQVFADDAIASNVAAWVANFQGAVDIREFGVLASNSASVNATRLAQAMTYASAAGLTLLVTELGVQLDADITVPVASGSQVSIVGTGWRSGFTFTGSGVTKGFNFNKAASAPQTYDYAGGLYNMSLTATSGAKRLVTAENLNHFEIERCKLSGSAESNIYVKDVLMHYSGRNLLLTGGDGSNANYTVTGTGSGTSYGTTFMWNHNRISGGLAGGVATKLAGLAIDRCPNITMCGGAIESNGTPLIIGGAAEATNAVQGVSIIGIDFENPGNGNYFIEMGTGWVGPAFSAVNNVDIIGCLGYESGTTTMPGAIKFTNCMDVVVRSSCRFVPATTTVANYNLSGTGNLNITIESCRTLFGYTSPYVVVNGVQDIGASPYVTWYQNQPQKSLLGTHKIISGSTPSGSIYTPQGGAYHAYYVAQAGATNFSKLLDVPESVIITMFFADGNTTLVHNAGGGHDFVLIGGANLAMSAGRCASFFKISGRFYQIA